MTRIQKKLPDSPYISIPVCGQFYVKNGKFVKVVSGQYEVNGRISNFWEWIDLESGRTEWGYGGFKEIPKGYRVKEHTRFEVIGPRTLLKRKSVV